MAREPKPGRSETLTIRLDPKTRFILEYLSRLKGQTITTVVERAIVMAASQETVDDPEWPSQPDGWQFFWDVSDGVRALKIAARPALYPTYEEEKRLAFCREHWPFFYTSRDFSKFMNHYVDVLWPNIDHFLQIHEDQRANDYFAAGKAMQLSLSSAQLKPPDWPLASSSAKPKTKLNESSIDDDEIPF